MTRTVVLLFGPPGAGKSTAARTSGLEVYDRDDPQWTSEAQFATALRQLAHDPHAQAVVIRSGATSTARRRTQLMTDATHAYLLTAEPAVLRRRVEQRGRADKVPTLKAIGRWYAHHDRDDQVPSFDGWESLAAPAGEVHAGISRSL